MTKKINADYKEIPVADIHTAAQPRVHFDVKDLAESIKRDGLHQPITVCPDEAGGYLLIMGERRLRAHRLLGLPTIKCLITAKQPAEERFIASLVENIQREDLSAIEEAEAYKRLASFGLTQAQIGARVGKTQSLIAQKLALLNLPASVQKLLEVKALTEGHGRQLLWLKSRLEDFVFPEEKELLSCGARIYDIPDEMMELLAREEEAEGEDAVIERYAVHSMAESILERYAFFACRPGSSVAELRDDVEGFYYALVHRAFYGDGWSGDSKPWTRWTGKFEFISPDHKMACFFRYDQWRLRRGEDSLLAGLMEDDENGKPRPMTAGERAEQIALCDQRIKEIEALKPSTAGTPEIS